MMMPNPPKVNGEDRGYQIFRFVMETGVTETVESLDLERALAASTIAVARGREISGRIADSVACIRRQIVVTLEIRKRVDKELAEVPKVEPAKPIADGGKGARLQPKPKVQPPAMFRVKAGSDPL